MTVTRKYRRLTAEEVKAIRDEHWQKGTPAVRLALKFNTHRANIGRILRNETWVGV